MKMVTRYKKPMRNRFRNCSQFPERPKFDTDAARLSCRVRFRDAGVGGSAASAAGWSFFRRSGRTMATTTNLQKAHPMRF